MDVIIAVVDERIILSLFQIGIFRIHLETADVAQFLGRVLRHIHQVTAQLTHNHIVVANSLQTLQQTEQTGPRRGLVLVTLAFGFQNPGRIGFKSRYRKRTGFRPDKRVKYISNISS